MTETQQTKQGTVEQNVSQELRSLKSEIQGLSKDIRGRINAAGAEAKKTWNKLDDERKRFLEKVEQAAEETKADLRHAGSDLKRRLTGLRQELKSEDSGAKTSQSQSSQSS
jgi:acyl-CoA reductase-like NAD-dependent aldehyde dehydrogenase